MLLHFSPCYLFIQAPLQFHQQSLPLHHSISPPCFTSLLVNKIIVTTVTLLPCSMDRGNTTCDHQFLIAQAQKIAVSQVLCFWWKYLQLEYQTVRLTLSHTLNLLLFPYHHETSYASGNQLPNTINFHLKFSICIYNSYPINACLGILPSSHKI